MKKNLQTGYSAALLELAGKLSLPEAALPVLQQAVTHPAFFEGHRHHQKGDNQRLEFLGDAVLDMLTGDYLYRIYPEAQEGELTKMRACIVCEASLAQAAREIGLDKALRLGRGSEADGDRRRASVLADAFEAVLGAVYVTQGCEAARTVVEGLFAARMDHLTPEDYEDKKSLLQELVQAVVPHGVTYRLLDTQGPPHCPRFEMGVYCGKLLLGKGEGGSKKEGEVAAAADALRHKEAWLPEIR